MVRGDRVLLLEHRDSDDSYWFLPGGATGENEDPADAALRELEEECRVRAELLKLLSYNNYSERFQEYSYLVDIGEQTPSLGHDPELAEGSQILNDLRWLTLREVPERERRYLWAAGLMGIPAFQKELLSWGGDLNYPGDRTLA